MLHALRVRCPWRDMHERYEKSVYVRFRHWSSSTYGTRCSPRWSILSCR
ncbi:MAG: hypothetical protein V4533_16025 [Pseudomonadota bacterium]